MFTTDEKLKELHERMLNHKVVGDTAVLELTAKEIWNLLRDMDFLKRETSEAQRLAKLAGVNLDNGRTLTCGVCGETAFGVCTHIADARTKDDK